ncbi:MAG: thioredoxin family protein [Candidatus Izemoplasmatales bacterium]|nr:thioredoxin family protein [Candidatus Izemoplasmatales bacterium]
MQTIQSYQEFLDLSQAPLSVFIAKTKMCSVCVPISAKLETFMKDYPEIPMYQIYLEDVLEFQGQQLIFTVPTIVFFSEGKEILRESRFIDFDKMERLLEIYQS